MFQAGHPDPRVKQASGICAVESIQRESPPADRYGSRFKSLGCWAPDTVTLLYRYSRPHMSPRPSAFVGEEEAPRRGAGTLPGIAGTRGPRCDHGGKGARV
jgi:hypothetical protein